jgi:hypothetical protein
VDATKIANLRPLANFKDNLNLNLPLQVGLEFFVILSFLNHLLVNSFNLYFKVKNNQMQK